ncbi:hypothetical protein [Koleobacter methoxysyntrophicus]|nr:hypothetical protein [Koleobacter methoxysyntrophicus]
MDCRKLTKKTGLKPEKRFKKEELFMKSTEEIVALLLMTLFNIYMGIRMSQKYFANSEYLGVMNQATFENAVIVVSFFALLLVLLSIGR